VEDVNDVSMTSEWGPAWFGWFPPVVVDNGYTGQATHGMSCLTSYQRRVTTSKQ
jgi:hypothetical protein